MEDAELRGQAHNLTGDMMTTFHFETMASDQLFVLDPIGSVLGDKFAAVGTGAEIAMGVLESEYREGLSVEEARPLILRAIKSAVARDISSGDGVDLLIITTDGIKEESQKFS